MTSKRALLVAAFCMTAACGGDSDSPFGEEGSGAWPFGPGKNGGDGGSGGNSGECDVKTVQATRTRADMLIVLDRSASMAPNGNPQMTDRWAGSVAAVTTVTSTFDDRIRFGLMTFPGVQAGMGGGGRGGGGGGGNVCAPGAINVPIERDTGDRIAATLGMMQPAGYTPTAMTLQEAAKIIGTAEVADQAVVPPRYVLLVTDGDPNCSAGAGGPTTNDTAARQQTIDAITTLAKAGIQTFVVGYQTGTSAFASTLDAMAVAGSTGDMRHRSVESGSDLSKTFDDIAGRAVSCSYKLDFPVDDPSFVLVTVAGKARKHGDTADGWGLGPDKQTVTLLGAACDTVRKGAPFTVQVVCDPVFVQ